MKDCNRRCDPSTHNGKKKHTKYVAQVIIHDIYHLGSLGDIERKLIFNKGKSWYSNWFSLHVKHISIYVLILLNILENTRVLTQPGGHGGGRTWDTKTWGDVVLLKKP